MTVDVVICGLGPAGRALAHRCLVRGSTVTVVDPAPERRWHATYAAWADELPDWLAADAVAATVAQPLAWGTRAHRIDRPYAVLDTARLQDSLDVTGARIIADRAVECGPGSAVLASGTVLRGRRVIDARGIGRSPALAEQTAYGLMLDRDRCAGIEPMFMDWRPDNAAAADAPRSFLYAVPLGGDTMLLEETCLVGRPALDSRELRDRLLHRLRSRGIEVSGDEQVERVRFPVEGGRPGRYAFGAAGGFAHPATGYSVASALAAADTVALGAAAWPVSARAVHRLRAAGLRALLGLPTTDLPVFFDAFFLLSPTAQRAYLSGRTDLNGTVRAMLGLFGTLPPPVRRRVAAATLGTPIRSRIRIPSAIMEE
ncbi:lycopene cyclase family protein [Nocardia brasiliensis]|uniref:lycopene cyclase family protein n=1 Tax=Nocardia brasiliensis TaxID=37326 RepID=UPI001893BF77|nr:lycopene cyclase family protein [Nocardia brasiliensis]MBF6126137.1 lycopene cyclase [Nocardia brasiliensis]